MTLELTAVDGIGEIVPGDDIAELVGRQEILRAGDVLVVTSKIVSKAAGLTTTASKEELIAEQTDRVVAWRGTTQIVRTHHGLTMAAAGIDNSNVEPGTLIPLPPDPDAAARALRARIHELTGLQVAVIVSDTAGRAWRVGQTDMAIGCAGLLPFESFAGRTDPYGNDLAVTAPAVADEIAGAAELASGKFGGRPLVIVRGLATHLLTTDDGPGAAALIRDEEQDMFGLGAREAVTEALTSNVPVRGLPRDETMTVDALVSLAAPGSLEVATSDSAVTISAGPDPDELLAAGAFRQRLLTLGIAHGQVVDVVVDVARSG